MQERMGKLKFKECEMCHCTLPDNREYYKRIKLKGSSKEYLATVCRECEEKERYKLNWKDGKLKCYVCGEFLDPSKFDHNKSFAYRDNRDKRCKKCKVILNKNARQNYSDEKRLETVLHHRLLGAKERAEKKNLSFEIDLPFIKKLWEKLLGLCAISKIPMTYTLDKGRCYSNVSIDQINHKQGYTENNVQLVCSAVNQLKSDWDMNTVIYICLLIINNKELIESVKHREGGVL